MGKAPAHAPVIPALPSLLHQLLHEQLLSRCGLLGTAQDKDWQ